MNTQLSAQGSLQKVEKLIDAFYDVCSERGIASIQTDWRYDSAARQEIFTVPNDAERRALCDAAWQRGIKLTILDCEDGHLCEHCGACHRTDCAARVELCAVLKAQEAMERQEAKAEQGPDNYLYF